MTPIEYLEARVKVLKMEQPLTRAGIVALEHTIHELNNCIMALQLQAVNELHKAQQEAGIR
jgi:hypothetical protein